MEQLATQLLVGTVKLRRIMTLEILELSNCCGASIVENTESDNVGMCSECLEWAEIEKFDENGDPINE